jgi:hypothetical protein
MATRRAFLGAIGAGSLATVGGSIAIPKLLAQPAPQSPVQSDPVLEVVVKNSRRLHAAIRARSWRPTGEHLRTLASHYQLLAAHGATHDLDKNAKKVILGRERTDGLQWYVGYDFAGHVAAMVKEHTGDTIPLAPPGGGTDRVMERFTYRVKQNGHGLTHVCKGLARSARHVSRWLDYDEKFGSGDHGLVQHAAFVNEAECEWWEDDPWDPWCDEEGGGGDGGGGEQCPYPEGCIGPAPPPPDPCPGERDACNAADAVADTACAAALLFPTPITIAACVAAALAAAAWHATLIRDHCS